jgi:integrase
MDHISDVSPDLSTKQKKVISARRKRLTVTALQGLRSLAKRYEVGDPDMTGLQIRIDAILADGSPGAKSWQWRFMWKGERQKLGLGIWPAVSQAEAHDRVRAARALLARGIDPRQANLARASSAPVVTSDDGKPVDPHSIAALCAEFMRRYIEPRLKHPETVQRMLDKDVLPAWRTRDARTIEPEDVLTLLDGIVDRGSPAMANDMATLLNKLFKYGIQRRLVAKQPVQLLFAPGGTEPPRNRALADDELAALLGNLETVFANAPRTASAIRIALYTACRRSELAKAKWSDLTLDGNAPLWVVPPENAKTGVTYRIPLVPAAVAEFQRLKKRAGRSHFVMPAERGVGAVNPLLITRSVARHLPALAKHGVSPFVLHDLRRTVRTGLSALDIKPHIAERCLNHKQRGVQAAYDVFAYADEKRAALGKWAAHLAALQ